MFFTGAAAPAQPDPVEVLRVTPTSAALRWMEPDTRGSEVGEFELEVRRCKLDPSLKVTCFQPLNLRVHTVLST